MLTLEDLPEDFTPEQFRQLDRESLEKVPFDRLKWSCQAKSCMNGTHVRDYGITPWYFLDRGSKRSWEHPGDYWLNLNQTYWFCAKHWKFRDRLRKSFDQGHIEEKMLDFSQLPIEKLAPAGERH